MSKTKAEYKIIADHLRSSCFLIADGILPSNEGRGYVLRRIMRRAMLQIFKLGAKEAIMYKLVDALIQEMSGAYPQLIEAKDLTIETLKNEEEKFRSTLRNGLKIIEEETARLKAKNIETFDGKVAFKLHDTYGFPLDLTQIILNENFKEQKLQIDIATFNEEMKIQKQRAKANWKGGGEESLDNDILKLQQEISATEFLGYDHNQTSSKVLFISNNNQQQSTINIDDELKNCYIILDKTPFYATSGGQKGDNGTLQDQKNIAYIKEAKKIGNLFVHYISKVEGELQFGQKIMAKINTESRELRTLNHSATHLMHQALKNILGNAVTQKGSNVDVKGFTFDFNLNRAMTGEELAKTEKLVNFYIDQACATKVQTMDLEDAKKSGAAALFGEKYEQQVRVVSMGDLESSDQPYSIELCGGTHVKNSRDIELFIITSEKSIASGIRRIEAKTFNEAKKFLLEKLQKITKSNTQKITDLNKANEEIKTLDAKSGPEHDFNTSQYEFSIENFNKDEVLSTITKEENLSNDLDVAIKKSNKEIEKIKRNLINQQLQDIAIEEVGEISFISHSFTDISGKDLNQINATLKAKYKDSSIIILFACTENKISALIQISQNLLEKFDASALIKSIAVDIGAKGGGGKKDFAMTGGSNPSGVKAALTTIKKQIS